MITGWVKQSTGRGIGPGGSATRGVGEATEAPLVGEEESDPPPLKISEPVGKFE